MDNKLKQTITRHTLSVETLELGEFRRFSGSFFLSSIRLLLVVFSLFSNLGLLLKVLLFLFYRINTFRFVIGKWRGFT